MYRSQYSLKAHCEFYCSEDLKSGLVWISEGKKEVDKYVWFSNGHSYTRPFKNWPPKDMDFKSSLLTVNAC